MLNALYWDAITGTDAATESGVYENTRFTVLSVQITGTFAEATVMLEGRSTDNVPWVSLAVSPVDNPENRGDTMTSAGIYEASIEGVNQIRIRVASVSGGVVIVSGILYDGAADGTDPDAPYSETFGTPPLIVANIAEQIFFNPETGDIVGYDRVPVSDALRAQVNLFEIAGGMGNRLIGVIPDTVRITGEWESAAFSFRTREMITGGALAYNAAAPVCETVTASGGVLRVSGTPALNLAQNAGDAPVCAVRRHGEKIYAGTAYTFESGTGVVSGFYPEGGTDYDVLYTAHRASAFSLPVPTAWNPIAMTIQVRLGVYAMQRRSSRAGALVGWIYYIVPRAILSQDAGFAASQTENAPTKGNWTAVPEKETAALFGNCLDSPICARYVYVPCGDETASVTALAVPGGGMTIRAGATAALPVKYLMPDGTLVQPDYRRLGYLSKNPEIASIDGEGVVYGESEGVTEITAYLTTEGGAISTRCAVSVTGQNARVLVMKDHILI